MVRGTPLDLGLHGWNRFGTEGSEVQILSPRLIKSSGYGHCHGGRIPLHTQPKRKPIFHLLFPLLALSQRDALIRAFLVSFTLSDRRLIWKHANSLIL